MASVRTGAGGDGPTPAGGGVARRLAGVATTMGVSPASWDRQGETTVKPAAALVLGGWAIMAWSRFGAQGLTSPRPGVRFVLIGFYAWLALAVVVWLIGRFAVGRADRSSDDRPSLLRIVQFAGLAHRPVILLGFVIQFAAVLLRLDGPGLVLAVVAFGLWMPAMLVAAARSAYDLPTARAAALVALPYLAWLATAGRFLRDQVGHLL